MPTYGGAELKPPCCSLLLCHFVWGTCFVPQIQSGAEEVCGIHVADGKVVAVLGDGTVNSWELEMLLCSS